MYTIHIIKNASKIDTLLHSNVASIVDKREVEKWTSQIILWFTPWISKLCKFQPIYRYNHGELYGNILETCTSYPHLYNYKSKYNILNYNVFNTWHLLPVLFSSIQPFLLLVLSFIYSSHVHKRNFWFYLPLAGSSKTWHYHNTKFVFKLLFDPEQTHTVYNTNNYMMMLTIRTTRCG